MVDSSQTRVLDNNLNLATQTCLDNLDFLFYNSDNYLCAVLEYILHWLMPLHYNILPP